MAKYVNLEREEQKLLVPGVRFPTIMRTHPILI